MTDYASRALLPTGLRDILPPDAAFEADVVHTVMGFFAAHGYERVKPPLIEFEDSLLAESGPGVAAQTFRVMDPMAQRMMGVRPDMTLQVARIATTRLARAPRPLRLGYAGQVLRVKGTQLRPERQFGQAGIELIGSASAGADVEVVTLAAGALARLGLSDLTVDLSLPTVVPTVLAGAGLDEDVRARLREAVDHKDSATVARLAGSAAPVLGDLLRAAGPAETALAALAAIPLPAAAAAERERLAAVVAGVRQVAPDLTLTVDPVENRGFEYHTGLAFTLFCRHSSNELGRGGRYVSGGGEPAVGATLFMDTVLGALPGPRPPRRIYLPPGADRAEAERLRAAGWVTVAGLEPVADARAEARRLGCGHALIGTDVVPSEEGGS